MNIDFSEKSGVIIFNDFFISDDIPLENQLDELKEDMLQVEFPNGYLLDIGWRPSFEINGQFNLALIKDFNWESPVYLGSAKNLSELEEKIQSAMHKL
ncbi:hypothetical protein CKY10_23120 [Photorhabdus sp. HUG-39]|uniref:Uncharacterized protein n=2 Tax=Photorhabdus TaxID=29487 RepID=A0ABX0B848_9GAMM|nr:MULTISPECIES: hypothetical protein [Photorhabdus]MCC8376684.1 hypothetical protein [Photorhabdus bodei]MDB6370165.1 hypothetical protein [Photorhabdus bodei]MDB6375227.1 hypothetical protein [Photorhabdus bodei]NDL14522.1 hypothetical protein [Photorhabdus kayaii]NDL27973.1 hypothetical protein [Photorhabdus kayaii]